MDTYEDISAAYGNLFEKQLCTQYLGVRRGTVIFQPFITGCLIEFFIQPT